MAVRQQSKHELVTAVQRRYARAGRAEKGQILDEFVAATGYHRQWAISLLRHGPPPARGGNGGRPGVYSVVAVGALHTVWCEQAQLPFTRSRPYWKNDQAHVEQMNWSMVRRLLGYDRYEAEAEWALLQRLYQWLRLWTNHWQLVLKPTGKEREGAKVWKRYDTAQTPNRRVLASAGLPPAGRERLDHEHTAYGPMAVWRAGDAARTALWRLPSRHEPSGKPRRACRSADSRSGPPRLPTNL
jgi:hypothetical protein